MPDGERPVIAAFHEAHTLSEVIGLERTLYPRVTHHPLPIQSIRAQMREMGSRADVPIEPEGQTKLLDACVSQAGVVGGGVPGG